MSDFYTCSACGAETHRKSNHEDRCPGSLNERFERVDARLSDIEERLARIERAMFIMFGRDH